MKTIHGSKKKKTLMLKIDKIKIFIFLLETLRFKMLDKKFSNRLFLILNIKENTKKEKLNH